MAEQQAIAEAPLSAYSDRWLNRNVFGMGVTSLLADVGYEMAIAVLPGFLTALGAPAIALGFIEGLADALSSVIKLAVGWWSDRIGKRKWIVVLGYFLTGTAMSSFALAAGWPLVLAGRLVAWFGKGIRGPLRDAMLAASVSAAHRGKAFGFHRGLDTVGAIIGPLIGAAVLAWLAPDHPADPSQPYRWVFLLTLVPGIGATLAFALLVLENEGGGRRAKRFLPTLRAMPVPFRRFLIGVGVFGAGDFSHTLLILAATQLLAARGLAEAAAIGAALYALRNVTYAAASYPIGALSDRVSRRALLIVGYLLGAATVAAFAALFALGSASLVLLVVLFALAGVYIAFEDSLEAAIAADLVPDESIRGTAYGVMGTVNSVGDLISSVAVGALWSINPAIGLGYAAVMMLLGALALRLIR